MNQAPRSVSPRGFLYGATATSEGKITEGVADPEIQHLYNRVVNNEINPKSWAFRRRVLEVAVRVMDPMPQWLIGQYHNPYLYGRSFEFFEDTLNYMKTGRRKLTPRAWGELLDEYPVPAPQLTRRQVNHALVPPMGKQAVDVVLSQWCARPKGFEDLLQTLLVMYGEARVPKKTS